MRSGIVFDGGSDFDGPRAWNSTYLYDVMQCLFSTFSKSNLYMTPACDPKQVLVSIGAVGIETVVNIAGRDIWESCLKSLGSLGAQGCQEEP